MTTERKRAEEALARHRDHLEELVEDQARDILNLQLLQKPFDADAVLAAIRRAINAERK